MKPILFRMKMGFFFLINYMNYWEVPKQKLHFLLFSVTSNCDSHILPIICKLNLQNQLWWRDVVTFSVIRADFAIANIKAHSFKSELALFKLKLMDRQSFLQTHCGNGLKAETETDQVNYIHKLFLLNELLLIRKHHVKSSIKEWTL